MDFTNKNYGKVSLGKEGKRVSFRRGYKKEVPYI